MFPLELTRGLHMPNFLPTTAAITTSGQTLIAPPTPGSLAPTFQVFASYMPVGALPSRAFILNIDVRRTLKVRRIPYVPPEMMLASRFGL